MIDNFGRYRSNPCPVLGNLDARTGLTAGINRWKERKLSFNRKLNVLTPLSNFRVFHSGISGFHAWICGEKLIAFVEPDRRSHILDAKHSQLEWIVKNRMRNTDAFICILDRFTNRKLDFAVSFVKAPCIL
jgi:hypothetical protein